MSDCIFCSIAAGTLPARVVWESETHIAFLTPFPNTEGFTVVIPKEHQPSYVFEATPAVVHALMDAARIVADKIDTAFEDVGRTGVIFEGFGVDHLHAKLFPMHGTVNDTWKEHPSTIDTYFDTYQGYISSHDGQPADDATLDAVREKIARA